MSSTAIGVVGLASLFKAGIDTLDTLLSAAQDGVSSQVLQARIDAERLRLKVWGDVAGLAGLRIDCAENALTEKELAALDETLRDRAMRAAVAAQLARFSRHFEDERLQKVYGLVRRQERQRSELRDKAKATARRESLRAIFQRKYLQFQERNTKGSKEASPAKKPIWAVTDEGKFRLLILELKAINGSLVSLLPAIKDKVSVQIRAEIMRRNDPEQLKSLITAADHDMTDLIAQTASLRLEMLSNTVASTAGHIGPAQAQRDDSESSVLSSSAVSPTSVMQAVTTATADPPHSVSSPYDSYDDTGALVMRKLHDTPQSVACHSWLVGLGGVPELSEVQPTAHPTFDAQFVPETVMGIAGPLLELDVDADRNYAGWSPGSTSMTGFARDMTLWKGIAQNESEEKLPTWRRSQSTSLQAEFVDAKWSEILNGLGEDITPKKGFDRVRELIGPSDFNWLDPDERLKLRHQITDLLGELSTSPVPSLETTRSIFLLALHDIINPSPSFHFVDFMRQMLLAREALLRIQRDNSRWYGGITCSIVFDMIASELWARNMAFVSPEVGYKISFTVLRQQLDGLLLFVDHMAWPFASEVHTAAAAIRESLDANQDPNIDVSFIDWAGGLVLPGASFSPSIIGALYALAPTMRPHTPTKVVEARKGNFGFVHPQFSYWHARSVVGKVLAPLSLMGNAYHPPVRCLAGWVGPCPPPPLRGCTFGIMVSLVADPPDFPEWDADVGSCQPGSGHEPALETSTGWTIPLPPEPSTDTAAPQAIRLGEPSIDSEQDAQDAPAYTARIDFRLSRSGAFVTFTLSTNSVFIAAPACRGTHRVPPDRTGQYAFDIQGIEDLTREPDSSKGNVDKPIVVINATGGAESEVFARAWCCQAGRNAVVWKREGGKCCFKCALMVASVEGWGTGVVIVC